MDGMFMGLTFNNEWRFEIEEPAVLSIDHADECATLWRALLRHLSAAIFRSHSGSALSGSSRANRCSQDRIGLGQLHLHRGPQTVDLPQTAADQRVLLFAVLILVVGQGADGNEAIGARLVQLDEQAEAGYPVILPVKVVFDAVGQKGREAVDGVPFRQRRAPLGRGCDRRSPSSVPLHCRPATQSQAEGMDQPAMHDQIGIPPDRGGEMGVAAQRQPEMTDVLAVGGLSLRAQDHLADQRSSIGAASLVQDAGEVHRLQCPLVQAVANPCRNP